MRTIFFAVACLALGSIAPHASAQDLRPTAPAALERGPHHTVWKYDLPVQLGNGSIVQVPQRYVELASGLNYLDINSGAYRPTREYFEVVNEHAVVETGPFKLICPPNIRTFGGIQIFPPGDSPPFSGHPLFLMFYEPATDRSVILAELTDADGEIVGDNQVIYPRAFSNELLQASVVIRYTKSAVHQDIVLETRLPEPAELGLENSASVLVMASEWTEFPPLLSTRSVPLGAEASMPLVDEELDFGAASMRESIGFALPLRADQPEVRISKRWIKLNQRQLLLEQIPWSSVRTHLQGLPQAATGSNRRIPRLASAALRDLRLPAQPPRLAGESTRFKPRQLAAARLPQAGFTIDWTILGGNSLTNYVFLDQETYHITDSVYFYNRVTLGSSVLKFNKTLNSWPSLRIYGQLECPRLHAPAIFTAVDDQTVGQHIFGSSNTVSGYYGYAGLQLSVSQTAPLHNLRFRHLERAVYATLSSSFTLSHCQIGYGNYGLLLSTNCALRNVLLHDTVNAFAGLSSAGVRSGEHLTFHRIDNFTGSSGPPVALTNSLLISVTNRLSYVSGANNATNLNDSGIFQSVELGNYYLPESSPFRDAGSTNISPTLRAELAALTTWAPVYLTNDITVDTVLGPQAERETGQPDLGAYYAPIDYLPFLTVSNATLVLTNGVVLGLDQWYAIRLERNSRLISQGTPDRMNLLASCEGAQEQPNTNQVQETALIFTDWTTGPAPSLEARWTEFIFHAQRSHLNGNIVDSSGFTNLSVRDCRFENGWLRMDNVSAAGIYGFTNNQFVFLTTDFLAPSRLTFQNNLFHRCGGYLAQDSSNLVLTFTENLVDRGDLSNTAPWADHRYNAFYSNTNFYSVYPLHASEKVLTNLQYESFGNGHFYYPAGAVDLIFAGNQYATNIGLYHYTVTTNQVVAGTNKVSIGYHYVARDANGQPLDSDSDGAADVLEDANGNGAVNSGETDWLNANDDGLRVYITKPRANSVIH